MSDPDPPPPPIELGPLLFSKTLTPTDLKNRFAYPIAYLLFLLNLNDPEFANPVSFQVVDKHGSIWTLDCHLRWDGRGNPKPEVYGPGWRSMVNEKKLAVGDQLNFYLNPDPAGPALFALTVSKVAGRIRLFGKGITAYAHED